MRIIIWNKVSKEHSDVKKGSKKKKGDQITVSRGFKPEPFSLVLPKEYFTINAF